MPERPSAELLKACLRQQSALAGFAAKAMRATDLDGLLGEGASLVAATLSLDHARILVVEPNGADFRLAAKVGSDPRGGAVGSVGACTAASEALALDRALVSQGGEQSARGSLDCQAHTLASVRMSSSEKPIGIVEAGSATARTFTDEEVGFLTAMADLMAAAIERRDLDHDARQAAESHAADALAGTMMMRELQHRMKNNLQVINSLINLQGRRSNNPDVAHELEGLGHRIEALRLIHDKLFAHSPHGRIFLANYARDLCTNLVEFFGETLDRPILEVEIGPDLAVDTDKAIPFGLFLNEFVSQSLKSVLKGGHVAIRVRIAPVASARLCLSLDAEGHGDMVGVAEVGFGRQLMEMMASQLDGKLSWASARKLDLTFTL